MTFVASNGVTVNRGDGDWCHVAALPIPPHEYQALREFFQHERDEELGRWRHPDYPNFYARRVSKGEVGVWSERTNQYRIVCEPMEQYTYNTAERQVARLFLEAHPEPKPWEDAKEGEVWLLTIDGVESPAIVDSVGDFNAATESFITGTPDMDRITAARRIYPESD